MKSLRTNFFLVTLGLSLLGIVMVYSATYREYGTHLLVMRSVHTVLGLIAFLVVSHIRYTAWRRYAPALYVVVLVSLVLVMIPGIGQEIGGSRRWFDLKVFSLQPAEFAKLAAVLTLSCAVARRRPGSGMPLGPLLAVGLLFALVLLEPDFGTSVVLLSGAAGALWASEIRTRVLLAAGGIATAGLVLVMVLEPYRRARFMSFLDPWSTASGSGYQIVQSMVAIKSGSILGSGAGAGAQGAYVPEAQTDMIFALIGEELGLLGMIAVIAAFSFLALAGFRIAMSAPSVMSRCLAAGLTTMLTVQALFNMGAAMGALPLAGMTLPFVSYGGSSLIVSFAAVGILYRISEDSERAREVKPRKKTRANPARSASAGPDRRRRDGRTRDSRVVRGR